MTGPEGPANAELEADTSMPRGGHFVKLHFYPSIPSPAKLKGNAAPSSAIDRPSPSSALSPSSSPDLQAKPPHWSSKSSANQPSPHLNALHIQPLAPSKTQPELDSQTPKSLPQPPHARAHFPTQFRSKPSSHPSFRHHRAASSPALVALNHPARCPTLVMNHPGFPFFVHILS